MLEIRHMTTELQTHDGAVRAVDDLSFTVHPGEVFALVGESGCGKSMTALSVMRLLPDNGIVSEGDVLIDGEEILGLPESQMRYVRAKKVGIIFQEPASSLNPVMTVGEQIAETIELHTPLKGKAAVSRAVEWLARVGIAEPELRAGMFPHELSGGQKQRVMIAMALAAEPEYLIADEPTTALDVTIQAQILELLDELRRKYRLGILLITHDLAVVAQIADTVGLMYAGQLIETAPAEDFFRRPLHPYARSLLEALPDGKRKEIALKAPCGSVPNLSENFTGCRFAPRCPHARPLCRSSRPLLENKGSRSVRCFYPETADISLSVKEEAVPESAVKETVLNIEHYSVRFPLRSGWFEPKRYVTAVDDVSLKVRRGCTTAVVGESGSGKTTLARGVLQLLRNEAEISGKAELLGCDLGTLDERALREQRRKMQVIFQDPFSSLNPRMRIKEMLQEGLLSLRPDVSRSEGLDRIEAMLAQCGLPADAMNRYPHEFSGGQRQRLAIARSLVIEPQILICDEPTSALDVSVQAQILNLLTEIQKKNDIALLFITHNFAVVHYLADEIAVMQHGRLVESGTASKIFNHPEAAYTQKLFEAVPHL